MKLSITEQCLTSVDNKFDLVLLAAQRVRDITRGSRILIDCKHEKHAVIALREIAAGKVDVNELQVSLRQFHSPGENVDFSDISSTKDIKEEGMVIDDDLTEESLIADLNIEGEDE